MDKGSLFSVYGCPLEFGMWDTWPVGSFMLFLGTKAILSNRTKYHNIFQCVSLSAENSRPFLHSRLNRAPSWSLSFCSLQWRWLSFFPLTLKMLRKWDGNADRPTSCLFFWATGRARYLLSHLLYLIVHCAGAGWRGDCSSPEIPSGALPLVIPGATSTQSHGHCQSVFSFIHSKTPLKGRGLHEKGTLDVFRKVLLHKAAYARSCTSVHNVSKEIICLGRCCFTWKHLPAARFHQRADLWIDFPSMTSSICRALQSPFISSAVVRDWSDKMEQLTKRHSAPRHCPRSTASARMGQWQKESHSAGARDCHRKCCEHRQ